MGTNLWAPLPGFEPYERPEDKFDPLDHKASDLRAFLRSEEVQRMFDRKEESFSGVVTLPNGARGQLTQRTDGWELAVHVKRDWFKVYKARTRDEVLRLAIGESHVRDA